MKRETVEVWDAICRRSLGKSADECGPAMYAPATVQEGVYGIAMELGGRETVSEPMTDSTTEALLEKAFRTILATDAFGALKMLSPRVRDTARAYVQELVVIATVMTTTDLEYGPMPAGLSGRPLAMCALALEILETRSLQRLLAERHPTKH